MSKHLARIGTITKTQEIFVTDKAGNTSLADNIQTAFVYGFEVIVSKHHKVGDVGVFFEASDTQLSDEYCKNNNLYRHSELNNNPEKAGYLEDNRKLKVQRFLKVKSEGLFMPLESLEFTGGDVTALKVGDAFEEFNGVKICQKFYNKQTFARLGSNKKIRNIETPLFHEHVDTEQLAYYVRNIKKGSLITISHKKHGTSHRVSYTKTLRKIQRPEISYTFNKRLGRNIKSVRYVDDVEENYEHIAGSRKVVLMPEQSEKVGFHGPETWRFDILDDFKPYLEKNMSIYMEVVGFVNGTPIMGSHDVTKLRDDRFTKKYGKNIIYKYGCRPDEYKIMVYRISMTNLDGIEVDFTPFQLAEWCERRSIPYSKPIVEPFFYDGDEDKLMSLVKALTEREEVLCEDYEDPSHINEGVIIRVDTGNMIPTFFKHKSFPFKVLEGIQKLDDNYVDIEDAS
jgi:hypothetical protein